MYKAPRRRRINKKRLVVLATLVLLCGIFGIGLSRLLSSQAEEDPYPRLTVTSPYPTSTPRATAKATPKPTATPDTVNLPKSFSTEMAFTSQATHAIWDSLAKETCEEASALMAQWWVLGKQGEKSEKVQNRIPPDTARAQLVEITEWEEKTFGFHLDTTAAQTLRFLQEKLGVKNSKLTTDITARSLKEELVKGNIIILPLAGRRLNNPYFTPPGPPYHNLVVRGYDERGFITNDPGMNTKGENYMYPEDVLISAVHDWTGNPDTIEQGQKIGIIVGK
ncbi:MAG TPA: hypothetical protein VLA04_03230 [Verrucomicrobiae bacterium]|nr:hypothetical protein [Verrucomicrobiae bacterium]